MDYTLNNMDIAAETPKAWGVLPTGGSFGLPLLWLPKSQVGMVRDPERNAIYFTLPAWLFQKKRAWVMAADTAVQEGEDVARRRYPDVFGEEPQVVISSRDELPKVLQQAEEELQRRQDESRQMREPQLHLLARSGVQQPTGRRKIEAD